jgi:hypothetical protein
MTSGKFRSEQFAAISKVVRAVSLVSIGVKKERRTASEDPVAVPVRKEVGGGRKEEGAIGQAAPTQQATQ